MRLGVIRMNDQLLIDTIKDEADRLEEDCKYGAKGHFNASSLWQMVHFGLGIGAAVFAGLTVLTSMPEFLDGLLTRQLSAVLAAIFAAVLTFLNPVLISVDHKSAGEKLNALKSKCRRLRVIDCINGENQDLRIDLESLCKQKDRINANAPKVPWLAHQMARFGIWIGEADHAVDKG